MRKNTSSKNSATKSTKSPAKSKSKTTKIVKENNLDDLAKTDSDFPLRGRNLQKNLLTKQGDVVEKFVNASMLKHFDWGTYQELYEKVDWLPKISHFDKVNENVCRFEIEWIDGVLLDDLYNDKDNVMQSDFKSLHYYQVLNMYLDMMKFSKSRSNKVVFFHHDVSPSNIICTPNDELILIDPDSFAWGDNINFVTNIISKYSKWLFKILETHETDK